MEYIKSVMQIILTGTAKRKRNLEELDIEACGVDSFLWPKVLGTVTNSLFLQTARHFFRISLEKLIRLLAYQGKFCFLMLFCFTCACVCVCVCARQEPKRNNFCVLLNTVHHITLLKRCLQRLGIKRK
jgi:hypothetical protein